MLHFIKGLVSNDLYIQLWSSRLKILNITTKEKYDEEPWMALKNNKKGQPIVIAIGNSVKTLPDNEYDQLVNPFDHPRLLVHDFIVAEKILQHAFRELHKNRLFVPSPRVIFHPMEKLEGGVTGIEERVYREMCLGAGAREIELYFGPELPDSSVDFEMLKRENS
jgi:rod shape-determining protein MreB